MNTPRKNDRPRAERGSYDQRGERGRTSTPRGERGEPNRGRGQQRPQYRDGGDRRGGGRFGEQRDDRGRHGGRYRDDRDRDDRGGRGSYGRDGGRGRDDDRRGARDDRRPYGRDRFDRDTRSGGRPGDRDQRGSGYRGRDERGHRDRDDRGFRDERGGRDRGPRDGGYRDRDGRGYQNRDDRGGYRGRDRDGGFRDRRDERRPRDRDDRGFRDERGGRDRGPRDGGYRDRDGRGYRDRDERGGRDRGPRAGGYRERDERGGRDQGPRDGGYRRRDERGGRERGPRDGDRGRDGRPGRDRAPGGRGSGRSGPDRRGGDRPAERGPASGESRGGDRRAERDLSRAAHARLRALREEYDPNDDDRSEEPRDTYADVPGGIRLQKALAQAGVASRRASEELIALGRVTVDGQVVRRFGARVDPEKSEIRVDDMRVVTAPDLLYFALNKPRGVVSTMSDPEGRPTLADYCGQTEERLFHVGRLDTETEGLILLTNDGELANRLTHPRYRIVKTYIAMVPGPVPREVVRQLREGVELEDGPVEVDSFRVVDDAGPKSLVEIQLHEGRKHIVRRLMEAVGHPVSDLARTQIGPIGLNTLKAGTMRALTSREVSELYTAAGM
ncbi:pseudouridine synthase [Marinactinospora rubrisoli]|uniref:Pseudouridine synthase n=1 Tax=Marinactinospora rubrisoli TaxID=2715399 RepID=A0ABW2KEN2_9ACTN